MRQWAWAILAIAACGDNRLANVPTDGDAVIDAAAVIDAPPGYLVESPAILDFGGVLVSRTSTERVMAFTNTSFQDSGPLHLLLGGVSPARFEIASTTCTGVLAPAASCSARVVFSPSSITDVTATLVLTDGVATVTGTVMGSGTIQTGIAISPAFHDFGHQPPGQSVTASFTVSNIGNVATTPLAISVTGGDIGDFFVIDDTCSNVALGDLETCTVTVNFRSYSTGPRTSSLEATAGAVGPVYAGLQGSCCAPPPYILTPSSATFGTVAVGQTSSTQDFTLENGWNQPTSTIMISFLGNDPGDFIKVADTCDGQILAAHATCTISLAFRPTAMGARSASVNAFATTGGVGYSWLDGTGQ